MYELHFEVDFIVRNSMHTINGVTVIIHRAKRLHNLKSLCHRGNFDKRGLVYSSKTVVNLLYQLEAIVTECFRSETLHRDSILDILEIVKKIEINYIGCN